MQGSGAASERILVVDDESGLQAAHVRILSAAGFEVDACASAEEAVERLRAGQRYAVVVTDLVMQGMSGIDLLEYAHRLDADLPVVILTGRPSLRSTIAAVEHHSFRYLIKPVTPLVLSETVTSAAAKYRLSELKRRALELCESEGWGAEDGATARNFDISLSQLYLAFQPIVQPSEGRVFGYEALVRSGAVALSKPDELFSAAERLGRVQELGRAIRKLAAQQLAREAALANLFVNLHASDLMDPELYRADAPLTLHAPRVVLEITERRSLDGIEDLRERLKELRAFGYRIAVDDLGAGYAGLSCFNVLEPEIVKLDMSLIRHVDTSPRKRALVETMVRVCTRDLGIQVVCEGVETTGERDVLVEIGVPLLQGYLFGRPAKELCAPQQLELHSEQRLIASLATATLPLTKLAKSS
ncbi:MAG TPA: EAL domain-containing protein [Polyangiaceae bacterium]|nr:EAL domain-containing protein [Polyangiaceae bacterium]